MNRGLVKSWRAAGIVATLAVCARPAAAQSPSGQAPTSTAQPPAAPSTGDKEIARAHFEKAVRLQGEGSWDPALAEYRESISLYPTRAATKNAAICLQLLLRYDEALKMFESLLKWPNLSDSDRALATQSIARLDGLLATVEIEDGPAGARVSIDGRERGALPLAGPLRVTAGSHLVRVHKDGFFPIERRVDVAGGTTKRVTAELVALTAAGQLKVVEASGKKLNVVVDNLVVGETPWQGSLDVGAHAVWLQGAGKWGTVPTAAWVKRDRDTVLKLSAEPLPGFLRVEPSPVGATVVIDSVEVSHGTWEGRLTPGAHRVDIMAEGYAYQTRIVVLERDAPQVVTVRLEQGGGPSEPENAEPAAAPTWTHRVRVDAKVAFAGMIHASRPIGAPCRGYCAASSMDGFLGRLDAGYEISPRLWIGPAAGVLVLAGQRDEKSAGLLAPVGRPFSPELGAVSDSFTLTGALLGGFAALRREGAICFTGRLGAGFLLGALSDTKSAFFTDSTGLRYPTGPVTQSLFLDYVYVNPELTAAWRLTDKLELGAGLGALFLGALDRPIWPEDRQVFAGNDGLGHYHKDALLGRQLAVITAGLDASYRF